VPKYRFLFFKMRCHLKPPRQFSAGIDLGAKRRVNSFLFGAFAGATLRDASTIWLEVNSGV
jgi:hypothetical protein